MFIPQDRTNVSVVLRIVDSTDGTPETGVVFNTAGIDLWYRREGAVSTDITEATLAALTTAHTDGGFLHINDGYYRLDVPDAAFVTGVDGVQIGGTVTGMVVFGPYIQIVMLDIFDDIRAGLLALPNANADAAGGLVISDAGAQDFDAMNTAAIRLTAVRAAVLTDWINGGRLDAILDLTALEATVAALNDISATDVSDELDTALGIDTLAELLDAVPAATPTIKTAIMAVYMDWRDKAIATATLKTLHNNAGTAIIKWALSDDGTTAVKEEAVAQT